MYQISSIFTNMKLSTALTSQPACVDGIALAHAAELIPPHEVLFVADYSGGLHTVRFDLNALNLTPVFNTAECGEIPS
jgi:hypothetical protein